jgi:hypothetical protein
MYNNLIGSLRVYHLLEVHAVEMIIYFMLGENHEEKETINEPGII